MAEREKRARRLAQIAAWVNGNRPELEAKTERSWSSTDRKVGRLRWPGRGRRGTKIVVTLRRTGVVLLAHDSSETYRRNSEVEAWLKSYLGEV